MGLINILFIYYQQTRKWNSGKMAACSLISPSQLHVLWNSITKEAYKLPASGIPRASPECSKKKAGTRFFYPWCTERAMKPDIPAKISFFFFYLQSADQWRTQWPGVWLGTTILICAKTPAVLPIITLYHNCKSQFNSSTRSKEWWNSKILINTLNISVPLVFGAK